MDLFNLLCVLDLFSLLRVLDLFPSCPGQGTTFVPKAHFTPPVKPKSQSRSRPGVVHSVQHPGALSSPPPLLTVPRQVSDAERDGG